VLVSRVITTAPVFPVTPKPFQVKVEELPPTEQAADKVTVPPPIGKDVGVGVIEQPLGTGGATATTMDVGEDCPVELDATTLNVDVSWILVVTGFDVFPEIPGPVQVKLVGDPVVHAAVKVTAPPEAGSELGEAEIEQPLGAGALTRTVTLAGAAAPPPLDAVAVKVDVRVMPCTTSDRPSVWVPGGMPGPLQLAISGGPPAEQLTVNVEDPPPTGREFGEAATVQLRGGAACLTMNTVFVVVHPMFDESHTVAVQPSSVVLEVLGG